MRHLLDARLLQSLFENRQRFVRSEEHTSELQPPYELVCRLLLEKKNPTKRSRIPPLARGSPRAGTRTSAPGPRRTPAAAAPAECARPRLPAPPARPRGGRPTVRS